MIWQGYAIRGVLSQVLPFSIGIFVELIWVVLLGSLVKEPHFGGLVRQKNELYQKFGRNEHGMC